MSDFVKNRQYSISFNKYFRLFSNEKSISNLKWLIFKFTDYIFSIKPKYLRGPECFEEAKFATWPKIKLPKSPRVVTQFICNISLKNNQNKSNFFLNFFFRIEKSDIITLDMTMGSTLKCTFLNHQLFLLTENVNQLWKNHEAIYEYPYHLHKPITPTIVRTLDQMKDQASIGNNPISSDLRFLILCCQTNPLSMVNIDILFKILYSILNSRKALQWFWTVRNEHVWKTEHVAFLNVHWKQCGILMVFLGHEMLLQSQASLW